jgi:hypothetical protein
MAQLTIGLKGPSEPIMILVSMGLVEKGEAILTSTLSQDDG